MAPLAASLTLVGRLLLCFAVLASGCCDDDGSDDLLLYDSSFPDAAMSDAGSAAITMEVVSSRPDMVTGEEALVLVTVREGDPTGLTIRRDGDFVSVQPALVPNQRFALVDGLTPGEHRLEASAGIERAELTVTAYPRTGPVFSGPHEEPFACSTDEFALGAPLDEDCSAPTIVAYFAKGGGGAFDLIENPEVPPAGTPMTTTTDGVSVPFVIRMEAGTIDRAIYWNATLHQPGLSQPRPWARPSTWNGKLVSVFGGGCGPGYAQGDPMYGSGLNDLVGLGYAMMSSSLNVLGQNCNDVLSAEALMMTKERFIETFGVPMWTMGFGGSGGAIQQHMIADNYPGLLDGLLPLISYPDIWSILGDAMDCSLLDRYFEANAGLWPDAEERRAVTGFASPDTCDGWVAIVGGLFDPTEQCDARLPPDQVWSASNPEGARCTIHDHNVNVFGRNEMGLARRAWSNEGVQYGLGAFESGAITAEQFVHLNETIGSFGPDGEPVAARDPGDDEAVRTAYATGRVVDGGVGLGDLPILDVRTYTDLQGDFHDNVRTASLRARLDRANGDHDNHVRFVAAPDPGERGASALNDALLTMFAWLDAFAESTDPDRGAAARATKPAGLTDRCYVDDSPREGPCDDVFPNASTPRLEAGAPIANDVIQCALEPVDPADYSVGLTSEQLARLEAAFPDGVCDWDSEPPNRVPHEGPWQRF